MEPPHTAWATGIAIQFQACKISRSSHKNRIGGVKEVVQ